MRIISAKEAAEKGFKKYFTGEPCKNGHIAERTTKRHYCVQCRDEIAKLWQKNNPQRHRQFVNNHKIKNRVKLNIYHNIQANKRRAAKLQRTPKWLTDGDLFEIECIYTYAAALNKVGLVYHVDHIIPLQGKIVSGLHVPENLRVIPARENISKRNKFEPNQEQL